MTPKEFLEKTAYIADSDIPEDDGKVYVSKFNGSYITRVGMENEIKFLADREITEELTHGVGFSPKDGKWYGRSHRAIYGFEIGSTCKKGDCHYFAANEADEIEAAVRFWSDDGHINVSAEKKKEGELYVSWEYDTEVPNEKLRGKISGVSWEYDTKFGRGEWVAETMEDAKHMAQDFNRGVS
jgi:hypothetical protein